MKEFKVYSGDPNKPLPATIEDMGLCYVTKFIVEGEPIYSVSPKDVSVEDRVNNDDAALEQYGYFGIAGSIK